MVAGLIASAFAATLAWPGGARADTMSSGRYRIPYKSGTLAEVTNDHLTHEPKTRIDMVGKVGDTPYRIVAAADGVIRFIVDRFSENRPGESPCNNNYVWIEHPNGEWTKYSHMTEGSVTGDAGLAVGDRVEAGIFLGYEDDVGCASGTHLHFEVAVPEDPDDPIDAEGFIRGGSARNRIPRICGIPHQTLVKGITYKAESCESLACPAGMHCCEPRPGPCQLCVPDGSPCP
jgi:murein DD-endopeptidase MepM/ murein hydrolase activator NlpD